MSAVFGALLLGGFAGVAIGSNKSEQNTAAPAVGATTEAPATTAPAADATIPDMSTKDRPVTSAPVTPAGPKTQFGDGLYEVNVDIAPGKYKTTVPSGSTNCYWERMKNDAGGVGSIIANSNHHAGEPVTVTVAKSDYGFRSNGCGTWTKSG